MKILIIGPSGSGKTYLSAELRKNGVNAVDADLVTGLSGWFDESGNEVEYQKDANKDFLDNHKFLLSKNFLKEYLNRQNEIYLFGLSGNVFDMLDLFDKFYFLDVDPDILRKNLRHETRENPMGQTDYQLENALKYAAEIKEKAGKLGIKLIEATNKLPSQIFKEISV